MGDHHCSASDLGILDCLQHGGLVGGVQGGGALIKNENFGRTNESARDLDALGLSTRNQGSILPNNGLVTLWEGCDEVVNMGGPRGLLDLGLRQSSGAIGNVLADGGVK